MYRSERYRRLCGKDGKCLTVTASVVLLILSEFLHHEYLVKHAGMDGAVKSTLKHTCLAKEVLLVYVVLACVATKVSHVISILVAFVLLLPVLFVLGMIDGEKRPADAADEESAREVKCNNQCSPEKIDSNRIQPTSSTKFDPMSDAKEINTDIGFKRENSQIENSA